MRYTARNVTAAVEGWPLTVGKRTYWARPLSAALVLRVLPLLANPATAPAAVALALRAAFPRGRWWRRDPVRIIARLPAELQAPIITQLFAVPGAADAEAMSDEDAIIAAHRKLARPQSVSGGPTLAIMALRCQVRLGWDWWHGPHWPTSDGFAPLAAVYTAYAGLAAIDAQDRMQTAAAVQLAHATGPMVTREWEKLQSAAYPQDPTMRGAH